MNTKVCNTSNTPLNKIFTHDNRYVLPVPQTGRLHYTRVQVTAKLSLNTILKGGVSLTKDVNLNVQFRFTNIVCLCNRQSQHKGHFTCVFAVKGQIFKHYVPSSQLEYSLLWVCTQRNL